VIEPGIYQADDSFSAFGTTATQAFIHGTSTTLTSAGGTPVQIIDTTLPLTIRNVTFTGSTSNRSLSLRAKTTLEGVTIQGAKQLYIDDVVVARDLTIISSLDGAGAIVIGAAGALTVDRRRIYFGSIGISTLAGKFTLTNTMIFGTSGRAIEASNGVGQISFSTIADAGASTTSTPCAVSCTANIQITSSIIWQQGCSGAPAGDASSPFCTYASSIVSNTTSTPGTMNVDPLFVSRAGHLYHIPSSSPAKDAVDTGPADDFEGDPRPRGLKFDIGADEAPP